MAEIDKKIEVGNEVKIKEKAVSEINKRMKNLRELSRVGAIKAFYDKRLITDSIICFCGDVGLLSREERERLIWTVRDMHPNQLYPFGEP